MLEVRGSTVRLRGLQALVTEKGYLAEEVFGHWGKARDFVGVCEYVGVSHTWVIQKRWVGGRVCDRLEEF